MEAILKIAVAVSAACTAGILIWQVIRTLGFGRKSLNAEPQGDWRRGVVYAFGQGMMPWEKESARKHLITYASGFGYHFGIFAGLFYLFTIIAGVSLPDLGLNIVRAFMAMGLVFGIGLFIKRSSLTAMRSISCPDDYAANLLVDLFLLLSLFDSFGFSVRIPLLFESILLLLYIPVGKIRHCFFFFYSRILFGFFFGRRGVFPHPRAAEKDVK